MKLSPTQAKVVALTQLNADLPIAQIRSKLGLRDHTIRYALERARSQGLVAQRHFINLFRIGCLQHEIFFSLSSEKKGSRETLLKKLIQSDRISWIGRLGGDFHYGMNICSFHINEMLELFDEFSDEYGCIFLEKNLSLRIGLTYFGCRYLAPSIKASPPLSYRITSERVEIDYIDHQILSALSADGSSSIHSIARTLGVPQSTVDYRYKKLKNNGVIVGTYYNFQPQKAGYLSFLCLISTKGISSSFREKVLQFCEDNPEVVVLIESMGSWDFELAIDVREAEHAMTLSEKILDYFGSTLHWIKMIPLFGYPKVREYPFQKIRP